MKKIGLLIVGGIAAIVLMANLGPMVGLAVGLLMMYFAYKKFKTAETGGKKFIWGAIAVIALCISVSNLPAILGVVAIYAIYVVYKKWNEEDGGQEKFDENDPFTSFERQWADLKKS